LLTEENIRRGMTREEARRAARVRLGGVAQLREKNRELRGQPWAETLVQDLRYGLRMPRKNPGFTAVAILTLALGIGATTAIFSVVNAVLLRPLPYQDADRLVVILHYGSAPVSPANFIDWRRLNHVFERMGAAEYWSPHLTGIDKPERVWALRITSDILPLLGVQPLLGRTFLPEENVRGREHEAILSFAPGSGALPEDSGIIGRSIALDGEK